MIGVLNLRIKILNEIDVFVHGYAGSPYNFTSPLWFDTPNESELETLRNPDASLNDDLLSAPARY